MHPFYAKAVLVLGALLAVSPSLQACTGPKELEAKLQAHPDADTYSELGDWFGDRKQYDCALDAFQKGLKLEPGSAKLYYLVGLTLYASGPSPDALKPLGQSIFLMPEVLKPHLLLATALEQLKRGQEARSEWEAALHIDHTSTEALDGMSKSLLAARDPVSAIELLREAPHYEILTIDLALAYGQANLLDKSEEVLSAALKQNPSSLPLTDRWSRSSSMKCIMRTLKPRRKICPSSSRKCRGSKAVPAGSCPGRRFCAGTTLSPGNCLPLILTILISFI